LDAVEEAVPTGVVTGVPLTDAVLDPVPVRDAVVVGVFAGVPDTEAVGFDVPVGVAVPVAVPVNDPVIADVMEGVTVPDCV
jgi:hypothetical protein